MTAYLKKGGTLTGKLVEYVQFKHLSLSLGVGEPMRFTAADLTRVALQGGTGSGCVAGASAKRPAAASTPTPPPAAARSRFVSASPTAVTADGFRRVSAPSQQGRVFAQQALFVTSSLEPTARAAAIQALMNERADWRGRNTGLAAPLAFTVGGFVIAGAGAGMIAAAAGSSSKEGLMAPGIATLAVGGVALATGLVLWTLRTSEGRQERELDRIDRQLRSLGVQASVVPWLTPRGRGELAGGLHLHLAL